MENNQDKKNFFSQEIKIMGFYEFFLFGVGLLACWMAVHIYPWNFQKILEFLLIPEIIFAGVLIAMFLGRQKIIIFNSLIGSLSSLCVSLYFLLLSYLWLKTMAVQFEKLVWVFFLIYILAVPAILFLGLRSLNLTKAGRAKAPSVHAGRNAGLLSVVFIGILKALDANVNDAVLFVLYLIAISALFGIWGIIKVIFVAKHSK